MEKLPEFNNAWLPKDSRLTAIIDKVNEIVGVVNSIINTDCNFRLENLRDRIIKLEQLNVNTDKLKELDWIVKEKKLDESLAEEIRKPICAYKLNGFSSLKFEWKTTRLENECNRLFEENKKIKEENIALKIRIGGLLNGGAQ